MVPAKQVPTPLFLSHSLYEKKEPLPDAEKESMRRLPCFSIPNSLLYLSIRSRPEIFTAVSLLAKYQKTAPKYWKAVKHVVRYVKEVLAMFILLAVKDYMIILEVWSDADYARYQSKRRSRAGTFILSAVLSSFAVRDYSLPSQYQLLKPYLTPL